MTALVQVKVVEDLLEELWVLTGELPDARLNFAKKVGDCLLGDLAVLLLRNLPGGFHHTHEILVRGRAHGQIRVVVIPLLSCDDSVVVAASTIEVVEEVLEDFVTGLAALEEFRVHAHIVDAGDVLNRKLSGAISVHHTEGLVDHCHTARSKLVSVLN
jgi:hypothetical protein